MSKKELLSRFPQFLNWIAYELSDKKKTQTVHYEPIHLHIFVPARSNDSFKMWYGQPSTDENAETDFAGQKDLDVETFQFVLKQIPTIQTLEFSGWGEPLRNRDIFKIINTAYAFNKAQSTIYSHGLFGTEVFRELLTSQTRKLTINTVAHKPSLYAAITRRPAQHFLTIQQNIEQLLLVKSHYPDSPLFLELSMSVDMTTLDQIPDMIAYAEKLGVDGIRFENIVSRNAQDQSQHTIYSHYTQAIEFLNGLKEEDYSIQVTLPVPMERDMTNHRNCKDPHTTISLTNDLHISPCSRHLVFDELQANIWDDNVWNNEQYRWLRSIHSNSPQEVPEACQHCPLNCSEPAKVLNKKLFALYEEQPAAIAETDGNGQGSKKDKTSWLKKPAMWSL